MSQCEALKDAQATKQAPPTTKQPK